jgi:hypothetical protein
MMIAAAEEAETRATAATVAVEIAGAETVAGGTTAEIETTIAMAEATTGTDGSGAATSLSI